MSDSKTMPLLELWRLRCLRSSRLYYTGAARYRTNETILTSGNIVSSIFVLFFSLGHSMVGLDNATVNFAIAFASAIVVVTSILQYYMNYGHKADEYNDAGAKYAALNRKIEQLISHGAAAHDANEIRSIIDQLAQSTPGFSRRIWATEMELNNRIKDIESKLFSEFDPKP
jgi:hypothetical protein